MTGIDIAPNLIDQAIERAKAEGVNAKFDVGGSACCVMGRIGDGMSGRNGRWLKL